MSAGVHRIDELPLAEAKLAAPRRRHAVLDRPRLVHTLDTGEDAALTLVVAPAGYGKTTAVRTWYETSDSALAWVTLDAGDNDPARFWTYIATAVDRIREGLASRALRRLRLSGAGMEATVDEMMNSLADFGRPVTLVLDELNTVTDPACLESLRYAIERLPPTARVIAITRADPTFDLSRLRARGGLVELRTDELVFTGAEAHELLVERAGLDLDHEHVAVLQQRTEGWPAALCLAALWLRTVDDPKDAVVEFGGNQRFVAEYLSHEVLQALDPRRRSFLVRAAVLGTFTAELCDGVFDRTDSAALLSGLEDSNMFVTLERKDWFRVHPLFSEFATSRLAAWDPTAEEAIHRRASAWLRSHGMLVEAVEHAAAAGDHGLVAEMLSESHLALVRNGRASSLVGSAQTLPDDVLVEHPDVALAAATAATIMGGLARERRRLLALASRSKAERPELFGITEDCLMATILAAGIDNGVRDAVVEGYRAVELSEQGANESAVVALAALACALYLAGDVDKAWSAASRAATHANSVERSPEYALAMALLALIALAQGRVTSARSHADVAHAVVGRIAINRSWLGANVAVALGAVLLAEGNLAAAEHEFSSAEPFFADDVATVHHARVLVRLADVRCRRGRLDDAAAALRQARDELAELADSGTTPSIVDEVDRRLESARRQARAGVVLDLPSRAQLAVLRLLATDLSVREIGAELFLSANTVKSHMRVTYRKLGVGSREAAVARATALGLIGERERLDRRTAKV